MYSSLTSKINNLPNRRFWNLDLYLVKGIHLSIILIIGQSIILNNFLLNKKTAKHNGKQKCLYVLTGGSRNILQETASVGLLTFNKL